MSATFTAKYLAATALLLAAVEDPSTEAFVAAHEHAVQAWCSAYRSPVTLTSTEHEVARSLVTLVSESAAREGIAL